MTLSSYLSEPLAGYLAAPLANDAVAGIPLVLGSRLTSLATFTRASSATQLLSAAELESVGSNVLRNSYSSTYLRRVTLIEGGSTNECVTADMTALTKGSNATVTAAPLEVGVDGITGNVYRVQLPATSSTFVQLATAATGQKVESIYVKKNSETNTGFSLSFGGVVSPRFDATDEWVRYEYEQDTVQTACFLSNGDDSFASDIFVMFPQVEEGLEFASSYIPPVGSAATARADEVFTIENLDTQPWIDLSAFGIVSDFTFNGLATSSVVWCIDDGTANNRICLRSDATTASTLVLDIVAGGVAQTAPLSVLTGISAGDRVRVVSSIEGNNIIVSANGNTAVTDTSVTLPTVDTLRVAKGTSLTNGFISISELTKINTVSATQAEVLSAS